MDVSNLLSHETPYALQGTYDGFAEMGPRDQTNNHQHHTRRSMSTQNVREQSYTSSPTNRFFDSSSSNATPLYEGPSSGPTPKNVAFELHFEGASNYRARLPMRVQIFPHDTTESIVTTVKNFYGLYEGSAKGVSFEDDQGNTIIARYENFRNNMIVSVRVIADYPQQLDSPAHGGYRPGSPRKIPHFQDAPQMLPPQVGLGVYGQPPSRPASRVSRKQSASPRLGRAQRSTSVQKHHSRSRNHGQGDDLNSDGLNGYSSSDGGAGSVTSSRKARGELASAEISVDNIVEGNRRKRAKFESSELPLFVPPQVPAPNSISSISPQRRSNPQEQPSPFARPPPQGPLIFGQPLQSPQSQVFNEQPPNFSPQTNGHFAMPAPTHHGHRLRNRTESSYFSSRSSGPIPRPLGAGILPTPDPTIASCISDEDVALQLMRLSDVSNISHGRTSASTLDDAFSGRADAASSQTGESENESDTTEQPSLPPGRMSAESKRSNSRPLGHGEKLRKTLNDILPSFDSTEPSGDEIDEDFDYEDRRDIGPRSDREDLVEDLGQPKAKYLKTKSGKVGQPKVRSGNPSTKSSKPSKLVPSNLSKKAKPPPLSIGVQPPISPPSLPPQSRKTSSASTLNFQHQLGADEDDLSSKPRCQRCRKSKKGCDRQRPCQRCKDAGIGIEGCVSEDEGNGRKGRYGRHMGVAVKKGSTGSMTENAFSSEEGIATEIAGGQGNPEKSKKRKR